MPTTWIDSFNEFRQALKKENIEVLRQFFMFPLTTDVATIWEVCSLNGLKIPTDVNRTLFTENDFEKYGTYLFDHRFIEVISVVDAAELYHDERAETALFTDSAIPYKLMTIYDKETSTLHLNIAFLQDAQYENGEQVSEGEYNIIYIFDIRFGTTIEFQKIVFAG